MKRYMYIMVFCLYTLNSCGQNKIKMKTSSQYRPLTPQEEKVILYKGTERPYTGKYDDFFKDGIYVCKRCGSELYKSSDKFNSGCGWPSFDDEIPGAVTRIPDADGFRTEITCNNCGAHLGHVFLNEGLTPKNTRHCVNSISLEFIPARIAPKAKSDTAYFAGGCFWGVEYYLEQIPGVKSVESGYMGGSVVSPTYQQVCSHNTGHAEVVQVVFNPLQTSFQEIAKMFFEIHDPTQINRQGPDVGDQYRSEVFYRSVEQKEITEKLIQQLEKNGYKVATQVTPVATFWQAENYHQDYYQRHGKTPYCHRRVKRF